MYKRKTPGKTLYQLQCLHPASNHPGLSLTIVLPQGAKAMLRAGRVCTGRGQGQPFHCTLRAADGSCRARISAFSCDLAEDALVAHM